MAKHALLAHAYDELAITSLTTAKPIQAAITSAATFTAGAALPLAMVAVTPANILAPVVASNSLLFLALLGAIGAKTGEAAMGRATLRVTFWGALANGANSGYRHSRGSSCVN
jgi:vacuolar iron transporter family protein